MAIMDLREKAHCWAGCDGCLSCQPDTPYTVAWSDVSKVDLHLPAPEEALAVIEAQEPDHDAGTRCLDCTDPDCGS